MAKYIKLEELMRFPIRRNHYDKEHGSKDFIYGIETVLEYAENLQATDVAQEWISVKDRLPEESGEVLVIVSGNPQKNITLNCAYELAEYDPYDGWIMEMWPEWEDAVVTHWMPLPAPPKGE